MYKMLIILPPLWLYGISCVGQPFPELNTAKDCKYMKPVEREMIYEINVARNRPEVYVGYLKDYLAEAKEKLINYDRGRRSYSLSTEYTTINGKTIIRTDTIWFNEEEEEVKAIESLIYDLKKQGRLSLLKPDEGIYKAATLYGADQDRHEWGLSHNGSDGSWPNDRIKRCSPKMIDGNENIAGRYPEPTARDIVIQLLIDGGIPGYGHRYNMLNPKWTHAACFCGGLKNGMYRWLQEFGEVGR
ncbi:MAG: hypothetical protein NT004_12080 [Bacteroidetes bacterium]|nr:hypothetical protein [Bacteroidota bacterium]